LGAIHAGIAFRGESVRLERMMLAREGPIFDARRREFVTPFGGGPAAMPGGYFVGPQLGGPRPRPIELGRDPTASERAFGPAARSSAVQNLGPLSIKFRLLTARLFIRR